MRDPAVVFQTPGAVSDRLGAVKHSNFLSRLCSCLPPVLSGCSSHNALVHFPLCVCVSHTHTHTRTHTHFLSLSNWIEGEIPLSLSPTLIENPFYRQNCLLSFVKVQKKPLLSESDSVIFLHGLLWPGVCMCGRGVKQEGKE